MSAERDGRRVSSDLTEARTVLSRARTARDRIMGPWGGRDPAADEMVAALEAAITALAPFERIGRR
jgi:hypothetical protein